MATVTSGFYLVTNVATVVGLSGAGAVLVGTLKELLAKKLRGVEGGAEVSFCFGLKCSNQSIAWLMMRCRLFKERSRMWTMSEVSMETLDGLSLRHIYKLLSTHMLCLWPV